jgi:ATP-GRASP peptide maturase of grasp-with-spasm system
MVFLQSQHYDLSTNAVIEWLFFLKTPFVRCNIEDYAELISVYLSQDPEIDDIVLRINNQEVSLNSIDAYWHRRGRIRFSFPYEVAKHFDQYFPKKKVSQIMNNLKSQIDSLESHINMKLANLNCSIGRSDLAVVNKLTVLQYAAKCNIDIPDTFITCSREALLRFKKRKKVIITKSILDSLFLFDDDENVVHYTELLTDEFIDNLPDTFAPSLFQEAIDKKFELRIFYLRGKFYSMAIFSQGDEQTSVDFRKYNEVKPNRSTPYLISKELEIKLDALMRLCNLNSGSIDMLVSSDNKHYFLEVNPVGQFAMVSYPCNYYIEKEIALYLSINTNE